VSSVPFELPEILTKQILKCWLQNSERFGTVESIAEWWLLELQIRRAESWLVEQQIRRSPVEVQAVLEKLVAVGLVEQWKEADGRTYYRLNHDKKCEARTWVDSGE
jgi:predicted transcriptional regulator